MYTTGTVLNEKIAGLLIQLEDLAPSEEYLRVKKIVDDIIENRETTLETKEEISNRLENKIERYFMEKEMAQIAILMVENRPKLPEDVKTLA